MTDHPQRDIFFVSNSVDELGGVTSWSHQMARLFTERGHRVHVVGITDPDVPQELGELPYPTTTLYDVRPPRVRSASGLRGRIDVVEHRRRAERAAGMREQADRLTGLLRGRGPAASSSSPRCGPWSGWNSPTPTA